ncbi:POTRA domain-containing protein [uncultured Megasphaera sp.]|uniref:POTRA domain-containing protein n=1 Tax=uncultured Megasphaera sp. TaxID=165188 RepID=UPI00260CCC33|nr:POTRA domain-containing protein [uncultured Megasphaera sp.]
MNTRKKKLLVLMMTSAMMTCPVWASDETAAQPAPAAGATGYEPVGKDVVAADVVSAAGMSGTEKMAVNATITARADKATQDTMAAAQSGLTGYETEEELAAIAGGKTPEEIHKAAEVSSQETAAAEAAPGTGYEAAPQAAEPAAPAGTAQAAVPDASAQPAAAPVAPAAPAPKLPGTPVQFPARIGDFVVDTSVPNYPMAVIPPEGGVNLPYGSLVSDSDVAPYLNKTATSVTVSPVPDEKIEENILPRLAMRVGDAVNMAYIRHDLNVIGSTGIFSTVKPSFTNVPEGVQLNYTVQMNPVVNGIEITGNQSLSDGDIKKLITITPGSVLNTSIVSRDIAAINTTYNNAGYMLNRVSEVSLDEEGILHIGISEVHVEDISLRGNTKTRDKVILRELRFKKGDVFNREVASRSIQRVYNTGYFEDV